MAAVRRDARVTLALSIMVGAPARPGMYWHIRLPARGFGASGRSGGPGRIRPEEALRAVGVGFDLMRVDGHRPGMDSDGGAGWAPSSAP